MDRTPILASFANTLRLSPLPKALLIANPIELARQGEEFDG